MPLANTLGPKAPGQLIKSDDWNGLLAGVNAIEAALDSRITVLETAVAALDTRVGAAESDITGLRTDVDAILAQTFRVTLETTKTNFAIGELAEITATIRDARGNVPAPLGGERPWVDFVTTWGKLRPMPGFTARTGVADRTVSVQTNAQGVARARLSAEIVDDMTDESEFEFGSLLATRVGSQNLTIGEVVLNANTPADSQMMFAYQAISASYDSPAAQSTRNYVDSYYVKNGSRISDKVVQGFADQRRQQWRDHHITVLAFGKADSDPRTPDPSRGANSIQLTFRDWIGPWIIIDYLPGFINLVPNIITQFQPTIQPEYFVTVDLLKNLVNERVQGRGLVGKVREYEAMRQAVQGLNPTTQPGYLPQLKEAMVSAFELQQSFQQAEVRAIGGATPEVAFKAFANTAVRADSKAADVGRQVDRVKQQVDGVQASLDSQVADIQRSVSSIGGRVDATVASGGQLDQLKNNLSLVTDQVQALRMLGDPTNVTERLNLVLSLDNRLQRIERGL
jgi:hypothetical protein